MEVRLNAVRDRFGWRGFLRIARWFLAYLAAVAALIALSWWPTLTLRGSGAILGAASVPVGEPTRMHSLLLAAVSTKVADAMRLLSVISTATPAIAEAPVRQTTASPTATPTASALPTLTAAATATPSLTMSPTPTTSPTATLPPTYTGEFIPPEPHLWLLRPVGPEAHNRVDRFYPYGTTGEGLYAVHHGVEFVNPTGTVVYAVGPARVEVAGDDLQENYGYMTDFYGQLVILRLEIQYHGQPIYALYGHLSKVYVQKGQLVDPGEPLGEIGMTGVALGPHLHFEVRIGENSYWATRNPELWLEPLPEEGIIVGRVVSKTGKLLTEVLVAISRAEASDQPWRQTWTYATRDIVVSSGHDTSASRRRDQVNPDDEWPENWAMGDVPAGEYIVGVRVNDTKYTERVTVREGGISYVTLVIEQP